MKNVLCIHAHPKPLTIVKVLDSLKSETSCLTAVRDVGELKEALKTPYDEVAIVIDSMTVSSRIAKLIAKHRCTKNALVSTWHIPSLSLRGGMSVTYKPTDIPKQLADMAKTRDDAVRKALEEKQ